MRKLLLLSVAILAVSCAKDGVDGVDGINGLDGKDGTTIVSITAVDGGNLVTYSDGTTQTVLNGSDGADGTDGVDGTGIDYVEAVSDYNGQSGNFIFFTDGTFIFVANGVNGADGADGSNGTDGQSYTEFVLSSVASDTVKTEDDVLDIIATVNNVTIASDGNWKITVNGKVLIFTIDRNTNGTFDIVDNDEEFITVATWEEVLAYFEPVLVNGVLYSYFTYTSVSAPIVIDGVTYLEVSNSPSRFIRVRDADSAGGRVRI